MESAESLPDAERSDQSDVKTSSSDSNSSGTVTSAQTESATPTVKRRRWFRAWGLPALIVLVCGLGVAWAQLIYPDTDPLYGIAIGNVLTMILVGLMSLLLVVWFCVFSPFSRPTVLIGMTVLFTATAGWGASVKELRFDGDMGPRVTYRWEKPPVPQQVGTASPPVDQVFELRPSDVPAYRGVNRDGIFTGPPLNQDWQTDPPPQLWRTDIGGGYASMAVVGDSLLTIEQREQDEAVSCYDVATGDLKWLYEYPARFHETMGGTGPRTTPTVDDGFVFSVGGQGDVSCVNFFTGEKLWHRSLLKELQIPNVTWGMASSPLVIGDQVIVNPGGPAGNGLMSLDRQTGETIWQAEGIAAWQTESGNNLAGYSSPVVMSVDGVEQIVIFDGHGLSGHDIATGARLWHQEFVNGAGVNVAQPILLESGQDLFISTSYGNGSGLVHVEQQTADSQESPPGWTAELVWREKVLMKSKFSNCVLFENFVYGIDEGILCCADPITGKRQWKKERVGHGQFLLVNGQLLILAENGELILADANPQQYKQISRMSVLPDSRVWNPPVIRDGIVYVRDEFQMAAFDLRADRNSEETP